MVARTSHRRRPQGSPKGWWRRNTSSGSRRPTWLAPPPGAGVPVTTHLATPTTPCVTDTVHQC